MLAKQATEVPLDTVSRGIGIRWAITGKDGAPNFAMRRVEIEPGITFKPHHHPYEHEIYVLEGEGELLTPHGDPVRMTPETFLYVPPDEEHGYRNTGSVTLKFICVIPLQE